MFGKKREKTVLLRRLWREVDDEGQIHYHLDEREASKAVIGNRTKHVTGDSKAFCTVDMEPDYPDYEKENMANAQGFHLYFVDDRVHEGFDDLGKVSPIKALPDWKVLLVIGIFSVVAIWMVVRMMQ